MPLIEDLRIEAGNATFNALPLIDFTGGLNLTRNGFLLKDNESPDLLNVDIMPEGGICRRQHWEPFQDYGEGARSSPIRHLAQHQFDTQEAYIYASLDDGNVERLQVTGLIGTGPLFTASNITVATAGFPWRLIQAGGSLYAYNGVDSPIRVDLAAAITTMTQQWNDESSGSNPLVFGYEDPVGGSMPIASIAAFFQGKLWVAGVTYPALTQPLSDRAIGDPLAVAPAAPGVENPAGLNVGVVERKNRIHFSFPTQGETGPEDWNSHDWFDLDEGQDGDHITAMVACGETMYVFKRNSTYAVRLASDGTPSYSRVFTSLGAPGQDAVICVENIVYFFDVNVGLYAINPSLGSLESDGLEGNLWGKLEALLGRGNFTPSTFEDVRLGWVDDRLYVTFPALSHSYIMDPAMSTRPWTVHDMQIGSHLRYDLQPEGGGGETLWLAASTLANIIMETGSRYFTNSTSYDYHLGQSPPIESYYRTNWFGSASSVVSNPFSLKEWIGLDVTGSGSGVTVEFYGDQNLINHLGVAELNFPTDPVDIPIVLGPAAGVYTFPVVDMMDIGLGRDPVRDPCQVFADDLPRFPRSFPLNNAGWYYHLPPAAMYNSSCTGLPAKSNSLQLKFVGGDDGLPVIGGDLDWCIGSMLIQFRETTSLKTGYEAKT